jgi:ribosomal protein S18 acetylase RimI-like enzyme
MADVRLEPMTEERYRAYRREATDFYARSIAASGVPEEQAAHEAERSTGKLLPEGLRTPGHHLLVAFDGDDEVGHVWLQVTDERSGRHAHIFDFGVREALRRRGYGRSIMRATERWCRADGVTDIGLHVFAHNPGARHLYEQMGFTETGRNMNKRL